MRHLIGLLLVLLPLPAAAQTFGVRVTPDGMDKLAEVAVDHLPSEWVIPATRVEAYTCPGGAVISSSFPETTVHLGWHDLDLSSADGQVIVGATLDIAVATPVTFDNLYVCFGEATCDLSADLRGLGVVVELAVGTSPDGGIAFHGAAVELTLTPDQIEIDSRGCAVGDALEFIYEKVEGWALGQLIPFLEARIGEALPGLIQQKFAEGVGLTVVRDDLTVDAWLDGIDLTAALGLTALGGARVTWAGPAVHAGGPPAFEDPVGEALPATMVGQFQIAASDRLVNEVLFDAWRGGLISRLLADRSQSIVLGGNGTAQQIGLPADTEIDVSFDIEKPLVATFGRLAPDVAELRLDDLHVLVRVAPPGHVESQIDIRIGGSLAAGIAADQSMGSLVLDVRNISIDRIDIEGENAELEVDGARLRGFVEGTVMPMLAERLAGVPIAPAVLPVAGTFLHIRAVESFGGWQRVGIDLFTPDPGDLAAPETALDDPAYLLPAGTARFIAVGRDDETPDALLRYRAWLDGVPLRDGEPTSIRDLRFDATDGDHVLTVSAVDLSENVDPTPVTHTFSVDGVPPELLVSESPNGIVLDSEVRAVWQASDDRGGPIESSWQLRIIAEDGAAHVVTESTWAPNRGELSLSSDDLDVGALYEIEVAVRDEAGNVTSDTFGFALHPSLDSGCSVSRGANASPAPMVALLFAMVGVLWSRRRR